MGDKYYLVGRGLRWGDSKYSSLDMCALTKRGLWGAAGARPAVRERVLRLEAIKNGGWGTGCWMLDKTAEIGEAGEAGEGMDSEVGLLRGMLRRLKDVEMTTRRMGKPGKCLGLVYGE